MSYISENPVVASILTSSLVNTNDFLADIKRKLGRYGSLSEKQGAAVIVCAIKDYWYQQRMDARKAEEALAADVVVGKGIRISGEVVSKKWRESQYGGCFKMIVQDDRGFKVWGSVPGSIDAIEPGQHVEFVANVEVADDNSKFGFFKRPRNAVAV
jgi:hypothetical protein